MGKEVFILTTEGTFIKGDLFFKRKGHHVFPSIQLNKKPAKEPLEALDILEKYNIKYHSLPKGLS